MEVDFFLSRETVHDDEIVLLAEMYIDLLIEALVGVVADNETEKELVKLFENA